jgi:hypothetical protein
VFRLDDVSVRAALATDPSIIETVPGTVVIDE